MRPRTLERWTVTDFEVWMYSLMILRLLHWLGFNVSLMGFFLATYVLACIPRTVLGVSRLLLSEQKAEIVFSVFFIGLTLNLIFDFPFLPTLLEWVSFTQNLFSPVVYNLERLLLHILSIVVIIACLGCVGGFIQFIYQLLKVIFHDRQ